MSKLVKLQGTWPPLEVKGIFSTIRLMLPTNVIEQLIETPPETNPFKNLHATLKPALDAFEREMLEIIQADEALSSNNGVELDALPLPDKEDTVPSNE